MRKQLIELMKEARVKWPEGAKYATQDKLRNNVLFHTEYPKVCKRNLYWFYCRELMSRGSISLTERCHKWSKTIVTEEQYFANEE